MKIVGGVGREIGLLLRKKVTASLNMHVNASFHLPLILKANKWGNRLKFKAVLSDPNVVRQKSERRCLLGTT